MPFTIRFPESAGPAGKLADAEFHFTDGPLAGLKLIGFGVWERGDHVRRVTVPTRQYSINGERRSFSLLRPAADGASTESVRQAILDAYSQILKAGTSEGGR